MTNKHVCINGTPVTHMIRWWDSASGSTQCDAYFAWEIRGDNAVGNVVETPCDCMTCLVRVGSPPEVFGDIRLLPAVSYINTRALQRFQSFLENKDEEA